MTREAVAVLGAGGTMGFAMTRNVARAGFEVRAWDRSHEKAEPLTANGATIAETAAEAANGAAIIITMLSDADAVIAAMDGERGGLAGASQTAVWAQMSTIGISGTDRCIELAEGRQFAFADAPVLGTKEPAEHGELIVMASGPEEIRERLDPVFDAVGRKVMWVGEAGAGTRLKLVTNSWLVAVVEGAAETIALAQALGVDPHEFFEAIAGGPLDMPYLELKGKAMIDRRFEPASFKLSLAAKDAHLVQEAADRYGIELPLVSAVRSRLEEAAAEHGDEDIAAVYWASAP